MCAVHTLAIQGKVATAGRIATLCGVKPSTKFNDILGECIERELLTADRVVYRPGSAVPHKFVYRVAGVGVVEAARNFRLAGKLNQKREDEERILSGVAGLAL